MQDGLRVGATAPATAQEDGGMMIYGDIPTLTRPMMATMLPPATFAVGPYLTVEGENAFYSMEKGGAIGCRC